MDIKSALAVSSIMFLLSGCGRVMVVPHLLSSCTMKVISLAMYL